MRTDFWVSISLWMRAGLVWMACMAWSALAEEMAYAPTQDLLTIYALAKANDPAWASAQKANLAAQEKIIQGRALLLPTANVNANVNQSNTDIRYNGDDNVFRNNGAERFQTYGYTLNVSQPLYRPQNTAQYAQAKLQVAIADVQLNAAQQDLASRTTQAYFDVLMTQDKVTLIAAQTEAVTQQLSQAQASFKVGVATITDVNEAQAKLDLLHAQAIAASNALEDKKQVIESITGVSPSALSPAVADLKAQAITPPTLQAWLDFALEHNPELRAQRKALEVAQQEVERNHAGHLPMLDAVGSYSDTFANGGVNGFGNDLKNLTMGLQLQIPLYQGGAIASKEREAVINYQKAHDDVEQVRRKTVMQTRQAWLNLASSMAQVQAYEQALVSAQSQLDSTQKGVQVGIRNSVDLLNAQQQLYSAKRDLLESRYTYLVNIIKLKSAAGILAENDMQAINLQLQN